MDFVHLHLHTQYSLLDGAILIKKLIPRAKELGMKSIGITDHGAMHGVVDFYKACKDAGIRPVLGCEAYISPGKREDRDYRRGETSNYHLVLLAENNKGFSNLMKLTSIAQLEGFYFKPRIDKEVLEQYHEGIIALSACLGGEIPQLIMNNSYAEARDMALAYDRIMGRGNFYLELQQNGIPEQIMVNRQLMNISEETGIPIVGTCDCHYLKKGDDSSHTVLMCIQTATTLDNPDRMETASAELYFKSPEEMEEAFKELPGAVENSVKIAERCEVTIDFSKLHLPFYEVPGGYTQESYFRHLSDEGLRERLEKMRIPGDQHQIYRERLDMEMDIIAMKGYVGYYLIVWDFIRYARERGIPVGPGRGSGAGSLVAYAMKITDIDPIKLNLLFERFLNPERPSLPDFDIDFCVKRREEVIAYVREKYGEDRVAQVVTFGKLSGRGIIRDVCRVMNIQLSTADKLAKLIPEAPGMTLSKALDIDPTIRPAYKEIPEGEELLKHALNLEGLLRQAGIHAAGVVIADEPLDKIVPLCRGKEGEVLVQYEKDLLEKLGLFKFDFLGLANLTIIADAIERIRGECEPDFDLDLIPFDDAEVYEMLSRGESTGVFQLESGGMRGLLKQLKPTVLEDIIAVNALFRPGPMAMLGEFCDRKHGRHPITYPLPVLEPILRETYGVIVYQEQVMQIAQSVGGYTLGAADVLRRAMGKKDAKEMERQRDIFVNGSEDGKIPGAKGMGYDLRAAGEIFDLMEKFAEYGFNKSHAAAYAVLAYQTAYLRQKFPTQFLAAAMSVEDVKLEKIIPYIDDARAMGIEVRPPDINRSGAPFVHSDGIIWFGLKAVKNVGAQAVDDIIKERKENGLYKNIYDLCERVDLRTANKKVMESLIYAGAFDCFGKNRRQHLQVLEQAIEGGQRKQRMREQGVMSIEDFLFSGDEEEKEEEYYYPDVEELSDRDLLAEEKAVLSFYFTSHPVARAAAMGAGLFDTAQTVTESSDGTVAKVLGIVKSVRRLLTNKNDPTKKKENMASFILEDLTGMLDSVVFPKTYAEYMPLLEPDTLIVAEGLWRINGDRASLQVSKIFTFMEALEAFAKGLYIELPPSMESEDIKNLYGLFINHQGNMPVTLRLPHEHGGFTLELPLREEFRIRPSEELFTQLRQLCGENAVAVNTGEVVRQEMFRFEEFYIEEPAEEESYT